MPLLADYLQDCKHLAPNSLALAARWASELHGFLRARNAPLENNPDILRNWLAHLTSAERHLAPATVQSGIIWAKAHLAWAKDHGLGVSEQRPVKLPKLKIETRWTPSYDEVLVLQDYCMNSGRVPPICAALIALLPATGMRDSEAVNLKHGDWRNDTADGRVVWSLKVTKNCQPREVPMLAIGNWVLGAYLKQRAPGPNTPSAAAPGTMATEYLFPNKRGDGPIARKTVERWLRSIRRDITQPKLSAHALRRFFVTYLMDHGMDSATIVKIIGHSSLAFFDRYYSPTGTALAQQMSAIERSS